MYPHGPARAILSQPTLPRLRPLGRGSRRDPQPEGAPLSLQALRPYLLRDPGYSALYRVHKPKWLVLAVVTLLAHGCPVQAIVAAFGLDERTVARWQKESGLQCKRVHEHLIEA